MERATLFIALAGALFLAAEMLFSEPVNISDQHDLAVLPDSEYISFLGNVTEIRQYGTGYLISFDNDIPCLSDNPVAVGKQLKVSGIIERYDNRTFVKAMKITIHAS